MVGIDLEALATWLGVSNMFERKPTPPMATDDGKATIGIGNSRTPQETQQHIKGSGLGEVLGVDHLLPAKLTNEDLAWADESITEWEAKPPDQKLFCQYPFPNPPPHDNTNTPNNPHRHLQARVCRRQDDR